MKKLVLLIIACVFISNVKAQLTIEVCQQKARENYPLIKQFDLIKQTEDYNISNLSKGYLPQLSLTAKATYQSEVITIPIDLPNVQIPELSKDQYMAVAEINQTLWDGGIIRSQKTSARASSEVDRKKLEVDLYALNERINQIFFGMILFDEQLVQVRILQDELQTNYDRIQSGVQNGVANQTDLDILKVEQIKASQRETEIKSYQKVYREMISVMIGEQISENTILEKPSALFPLLGVTVVKRPEINLFESQNSLLSSQSDIIKTGNMPKVGAYIQGGYGKPGLDMLKNEFSPFYIGGIRLSWNISGYYSQKNNLNKIESGIRQIETQKETFLFNTNLKATQQNGEIQKIRDIIKSDDEIISLRKNIKKSSEAKVENGTLTVSDLVRDINAENLALQEKVFHEIQLINAIYNLKYTLNN